MVLKFEILVTTKITVSDFIFSPKPGAYYNVVGCIPLQPYKQPSVATKTSTGDSTGVNKWQ